jgi:hypothetical protein
MHSEHSYEKSMWLKKKNMNMQMWLAYVFLPENGHVSPFISGVELHLGRETVRFGFALWKIWGWEPGTPFFLTSFDSDFLWCSSPEIAMV